MVYENVPEHEGFDKKGAAEEYAEVQAQRPRTTDEWLARISEQLDELPKALVDAVSAADADDETPDEQRDPIEGSARNGEPLDADKDGVVDVKPGAGDKADTAKKTTAAKKTAEVKGD